MQWIDGIALEDESLPVEEGKPPLRSVAYPLAIPGAMILGMLVFSVAMLPFGILGLAPILLCGFLFIILVPAAMICSVVSLFFIRREPTKVRRWKLAGFHVFMLGICVFILRAFLLPAMIG